MSLAASPPPRDFDAAIVGGGIIGLLAALHLALGGARVAVLDRGDVWTEASAVNAGSLGVQNKLTGLVAHTLWSWQLWQDLHARFGIDGHVTRPGGYKVAMTAAEADLLEDRARQQADLGARIQMLTGAQIRAQAPWLSEHVVAASFSPEDGFASPTLVGPALIAAALAAGVRLFPHHPVQAIHPGALVQLDTPQGRFRARQVAIAAGAWTQQVAAMLGARLPVALDVNMVTVTEPAPFTMRGLISHARGILTLKQALNGSCLIGGGWQGIGTLADGAKQVDHDQVVANVRLALRVVPGLAGLNALRSWAGYEGVTPDSLPYLGPLRGQDNIFVAACARGGFTLGPAMAQLLAQIMAGQAPSRPIAAFDPARFDHG